MKAVLLAALLAFGVAGGNTRPAAADEITFDAVPATVGSCAMDLEVAATARQRSLGLMHRDSLPRDRGMVFAMPNRNAPGFWMKNTLIDLDIAFLDEGWRVMAIEQMKALDLSITRGPQGTAYALEANLGVLAACNLRIGDVLTQPPDLSRVIP
ncbi:MAG: DUF192 domain-containing protein [Pseudomonadota bacterium]